MTYALINVVKLRIQGTQINLTGNANVEMSPVLVKLYLAAGTAL